MIEFPRPTNQVRETMSLNIFVNGTDGVKGHVPKSPPPAPVNEGGGNTKG